MRQTMILFTLGLYITSYAHGQIPDSLDWNSLIAKAQQYSKSADYEMGIKYGERALQKAEKEYGVEDTLVATSLHTVAEIYWKKGSYFMAEPLYLRALKIQKAKLGTNSPDYAKSLTNLAWLYESMGRYTEAEPLHLEAKKIRQDIFSNENPEYATTLTSLGRLYMVMGRYNDAEPLMLEAKEINKREFNSNPFYALYYALSINNLAELYGFMGRYGEAEELFLETKKLAEIFAGNTHHYYAFSLNNLAGLYSKMGRYAEAESLFVEAKKIYKIRLGATHPDYAALLANLGSLYRVTGNYASAEPLYIEALKIHKANVGVDNIDYARLCNGLGILYHAMGKYADAELYLVESEKTWEHQVRDYNPEYAIVLCNLAKLYQTMGKYSEAEIMYMKGLKGHMVQLSKFFPSLSEREKEKFYNTYYYNFIAFNSFALERMKDNPEILSVMYDYQLATKALMFTTTNKVREQILTSNDTALILDFKHWQSKKDYLAKLYTLTREEIEKQRVNIDSIDAEVNTIERNLSKKSTLFASQFDKKQITWKDIQLTLHEDEAAVEIIQFLKYDKEWFRQYVKRWTDTIYYAALIITRVTKDHPTIVVLENGKELEGKYLSEYKLSNSGQLDKLPYQQYWAKIDDELRGIKRVYIAPDGVFNKINIETLLSPDGHYLLDTKDIRIVSSTRDLVDEKRKIPTKNTGSVYTADIFGHPNYNLNETRKVQLAINFQHGEYHRDTGKFSVDSLTRSNITDLPATEMEVKGIEALLKNLRWNVHAYLGDDALEEAVKAVKSPTILHIATHGYFAPDVDQTEGRGVNVKSSILLPSESKQSNRSPLLHSGLLFAGAASEKEKNGVDGSKSLGDDGILSAYEATNLDLDSTELVVLSACETGLGEIKNGEGVYGLQRAFQVAGAKTIIMSLWNVADKQTQELMLAFYSRWLSGEDKHIAFNKAKKEMKEKYPSPYYWGSFIMVGE